MATTTEPRTRFTGLAWSALILGIVGLVGSPVIIFNNLTAIGAGVGLILGIIAIFGSKRIVASIGTVLCLLALVATVSVQGQAVKELNTILGDTPISGAGGGSSSDEPADSTLPVGQTYDSDTLALSVSSPHPITTSASAYPKQNAPAIAFDVSVTNKGDEPWPVMALMTSATAGDTPAQEIYDTASGINGAPPNSVLPDQTLRYTIAFAEQPGNMVIQLSAPNGDKAYFTYARQ